jgi:hypothetical protein
VIRIAIVGDENETYPSHREINAVRRRSSAAARIRPVRRRGSAICPAWHDLGMTQQLRPTAW